MLSVLFIYWIWKMFGGLAVKYNKNQLLYFLLGFFIYLFSALIFIFLYFIVIAIINGSNALDNINFDDIGLNLLFSVLGWLGCYGFYKLLEKKWMKELRSKESLDNIGTEE